MVNQAVYGIVGSRAKAESIIQRLVDLGVNPQDISLLTPQGEDFNDLNGVSQMRENGRNWRTENRLDLNLSDKNKIEIEERKRAALRAEKHTKAPEGTTTGVVTGGLIGGALGLLAGIGALAIPGIGPFIAAGPLMSTLAGIGSGGTLGGIIGALVGVGIPEYEAKRYENRLKEGAILLSVRTYDDNLAKRVKEVLSKNGAEDVSLSAEVFSSKYFKK